MRKLISASKRKIRSKITIKKVPTKYIPSPMILKICENLKALGSTESKPPNRIEFAKTLRTFCNQIEAGGALIHEDQELLIALLGIKVDESFDNRYPIEQLERQNNLLGKSINAVSRMELDVENGVTQDVIDRKLKVLKQRIWDNNEKIKRLKKKNKISSSAKVKLEQDHLYARLQLLGWVLELPPKLVSINLSRSRKFSMPLSQMVELKHQLDEIDKNIKENRFGIDDFKFVQSLLQIRNGVKPTDLKTQLKTLRKLLDHQSSQIIKGVAENALGQCYSTMIRTRVVNPTRMLKLYVPTSLSETAQKQLSSLLFTYGVDELDQKKLTVEQKWNLLLLKSMAFKIRPEMLLQVIPKGEGGEALDKVMTGLKLTFSGHPVCLAAQGLLELLRNAQEEASGNDLMRWQYAEKRFAEIVELLTSVPMRELDKAAAYLTDFVLDHQEVCSVGIDARLITLKCAIAELTPKKGTVIELMKESVSWSIARIEEILRVHVLPRSASDNSTEVHLICDSARIILRQMGVEEELPELLDPYEIGFEELLNRNKSLIYRKFCDELCFVGGLKNKTPYTLHSKLLHYQKAGFIDLQATEYELTSVQVYGAAVSMMTEWSLSELDSILGSNGTEKKSKALKSEGVGTNLKFYNQKLVEINFIHGLPGVAAQLGRCDLFMKLVPLIKVETITQCDEKGLTLLDRAARGGDPNVIQWVFIQLDKQSFDIGKLVGLARDIPSVFGFVAESGNAKGLRVLVKNVRSAFIKQDPSCQDNGAFKMQWCLTAREKQTYNTGFMRAVLSGNLELVQTYWELLGSKTMSPHNSWAWRGETIIVGREIKIVEVQNKYGQNSAVLAIQSGNPEVLKFVLRQGAKPNFQMTKGELSLIHIAAMHENPKMFDVMVQQPTINLVVKDEDELTPFAYLRSREQILTGLNCIKTPIGDIQVYDDIFSGGLLNGSDWESLMGRVFEEEKVPLDDFISIACAVYIPNLTVEIWQRVSDRISKLDSSFLEAKGMQLLLGINRGFVDLNRVKKELKLLGNNVSMTRDTWVVVGVMTRAIEKFTCPYDTLIECCEFALEIGAKVKIDANALNQFVDVLCGQIEGAQVESLVAELRKKYTAQALWPFIRALAAVNQLSVQFFSDFLKLDALEKLNGNALKERFLIAIKLKKVALDWFNGCFELIWESLTKEEVLAVVLPAIASGQVRWDEEKVKQSCLKHVQDPVEDMVKQIDEVTNYDKVIGWARLLAPFRVVKVFSFLSEAFIGGDLTHYWEQKKIVERLMGLAKGALSCSFTESKGDIKSLSWMFLDIFSICFHVCDKAFYSSKILEELIVQASHLKVLQADGADHWFWDSICLRALELKEGKGNKRKNADCFISMKTWEIIVSRLSKLSDRSNIQMRAGLNNDRKLLTN